MTTPRTAAGRTLLEDWAVWDGQRVVDGIAAIELEAGIVALDAAVDRVAQGLFAASVKAARLWDDQPQWRRDIWIDEACHLLGLQPAIDTRRRVSGARDGASDLSTQVGSVSLAGAPSRPDSEAHHG